MLRVLMILTKLDMAVLSFSYVNAMITEVAKWKVSPTFFYGVMGDLGNESTTRFAGSLIAVQFIFVTSFVNAWINSRDLRKKIEGSSFVDKIEYKKALI